MKILFNLSIIKTGGGLQVALSVLNEWKNFIENQYFVLLSPNIASRLSLQKFPNNFTFKELSYSPSNISTRKKAIGIMQDLESFFSPDIVFTLFGPSYWRPKAPHLCGYALPHFIYSESPFFKQISFREKMKWKILGYLKFLSLKKQADFYITETEDASTRLADKLKIERQKVFTVNNAYHGIYNTPNKWLGISKKLTLPGEFKLITISSFYPHKNLSIIPQVIDYLKANHSDFNFKFILTIDSDKFPDLTEQQKKHILFLGKVTIEECPSLYEQSDTLFMPTLLECFTVSYLEAMKMEKPILTSDLSFAHDICQDAAEYFQPLDPKDIGEKIVGLANNKERQQELIFNGKERLKDFGTAADRAKSYIDILEKIVAETS